MHAQCKDPYKLKEEELSFFDPALGLSGPTHVERRGVSCTLDPSQPYASAMPLKSLIFWWNENQQPL